MHHGRFLNHMINFVKSRKGPILKVHQSETVRCSGVAAFHRHEDQDRVVIRDASLRDFKSICELSKITHDKMDYLPGWYARMIQDSNRISCVAEIENELVGFMSVTGGADDGKSLLFEGGRTRPDVQGSKLMARCGAWLVAKASQRWPQWQIRKGATIHTAVLHRKPDKYKIISKTVLHHVSLPSTRELRTLLSNSEPIVPVSVKTLTSDSFKNILADREVVKYLYPEDCIPVGYTVYGTIPSNVPFITYFHDNLVINTDKYAISIGGRFPCEDGVAWRYNFNYSGRADVNTCMEHLKEHLNMCVNEPPEKERVYLAMTVSKAFANSGSKDIMYYALHDMFGVKREDVQIDMQYHFHYALQ